MTEKRTNNETELNRLTWTEDEMQEFNRRNNAPFGEDFAEGNENMILSQHVRISQDDSRTYHNSHVMVIGGSEVGKTYNVIRPNLLRAFGSYIVSDNDYTLLDLSRKKLEEEGYQVKVVDFAHPEVSAHYNPLKYAHTDRDVTNIVNCILENKDDVIGKMSDPFFNKTEAAVLNAIFLYLLHFRPRSEHEMSKALRLATIGMNDRSKLDSLFKEAQAENESDSAVFCYETAKFASAKTFKAACTTVAMYLSAFTGKDDDLTSGDTVCLDRLSDMKTVVFLTGFKNAGKRAVLVPMLIMQVFTTTMQYRECHYKDLGKMNYLTFLMDDLPNLGYIPYLDMLIGTSRKYKITAMMTTRSVSEVRELYDTSSMTLLDACRVLMYIPGRPDFLTRGECKFGKVEDMAIDGTYHSEALMAIGHTFINCTPRQSPKDSCFIQVKDMPIHMDVKYTDEEK